MIVVMLAALVAILFFRDRCIGAVTGGFRTLAPMADGGARPTDGGPDARR